MACHRFNSIRAFNESAGVVDDVRVALRRGELVIAALAAGGTALTQTEGRSHPRGLTGTRGLQADQLVLILGVLLNLG